jgi:CxxC motif-containing protein (DUF1111 family)
LPRRASAFALLALAGGQLALAQVDGAAPIDRADFADRRNPPAWRALDATTRATYELGLAVFNTPWVPAGTPDAARRDGLGPLFVAASCDGCHNNGARGRGEPRVDRLSNSFVMQLGGPATQYGDVLNTRALPGDMAEGSVALRWTQRNGLYTSGGSWELREPHYRVAALGYGPLPVTTVLRPRIATAVFGAGLLEAVPVAALAAIRVAQPRAQRGELAWQQVDGKRVPGRFGWQAEAISIEDQTTRAMAREMGLTSRVRAQDDCTTLQGQCRAAAQGGTPEVSEEFLQALVMLQRELAVPSRSSGMALADRISGARLFEKTGCSVCHRAALPVQLQGAAPASIDAYTDLLLHDMGDGLADRRPDDKAVRSRWRTAPLWGMAHALALGDIGLLHDGRARSIEEAILWHGGQARLARSAFEKLAAPDRALLLQWVASL